MKKLKKLKKLQDVINFMLPLLKGGDVASQEAFDVQCKFSFFTVLVGLNPVFKALEDTAFYAERFSQDETGALYQAVKPLVDQNDDKAFVEIYQWIRNAVGNLVFQEYQGVADVDFRGGLMAYFINTIAVALVSQQPSTQVKLPSCPLFGRYGSRPEYRFIKAVSRYYQNDRARCPRVRRTCGKYATAFQFMGVLFLGFVTAYEIENRVFQGQPEQKSWADVVLLGLTVLVPLLIFVVMKVNHALYRMKHYGWKGVCRSRRDLFRSGALLGAKVRPVLNGVYDSLADQGQLQVVPVQRRRSV